MTASLDSQTETVLHNLVRTTLRDHTILHIAHKLESVKNYDRVVVMANGEVVDICSAEEYLEKAHHYQQ